MNIWVHLSTNPNVFLMRFVYSELFFIRNITFEIFFQNHFHPQFTFMFKIIQNVQIYTLCILN